MEDFLIDEAKRLDIALSQNQAELLLQFKKILLEWNTKMNLTAITDERDVLVKHFLDSLSVISCVNIAPGSTLVDVGTGAGFPGVPLKIAVPSLNLTLVDSLNKRVGFLNHIVEELKLTDVTCLHARAEDVGRMANHREQYDFCTSRAVAYLNVLAEYCLPLCKVGGCFIAMKGDVDEELEASERAIEKLGGKVEAVKSIDLPGTDAPRNIVVIRKVKPTPKTYPRVHAKMVKAPL